MTTTSRWQNAMDQIIQVSLVFVTLWFVILAVHTFVGNVSVRVTISVVEQLPASESFVDTGVAP